MQGSIAQALALTIYANDVLRGTPRDRFWPSATAFVFCKNVRFLDLGGQPNAPTEILFAQDPVQWVARLKREGAVGFHVHYLSSNGPGISDRMSVAFVGGGGQWLIESARHDVSDLWDARWRLGNRDDPEKNIWDVAYGRVGKNSARVQPTTRGLAALRHELNDVLSKIEAFASRHGLDVFAKSFRDGIDRLRSDAPLAGVYHSDLAEANSLALDAQQILGAAQAAWVFGGMGSWNDLGFEGPEQEEYERLSGQLFLLLNQSICEAANTGFPEGE